MIPGESGPARVAAPDVRTCWDDMRRVCPVLDPAQHVGKGGIGVPVGRNDFLQIICFAVQVTHGGVHQQVQAVAQASGWRLDGLKDVVKWRG